MLGLPKSTEFNKRIPKQKFYENMDVSPALRKVFVEQVKTIYWRNKIADTTTNLQPGTEVTELEVFEVKLNGSELEENLLKQIDKVIPYHIMFMLECNGKYQAWIGYKEASGKSFKVSNYYHTDWMTEDKLPLKLEGLTVDAAYENFVRQIAGERLSNDTSSESLKESIDKDALRQQLQKQIEQLQAKVKREKQLNKQMEINNEIKKLRKELSKA